MIDITGKTYDELTVMEEGLKPLINKIAEVKVKLFKDAVDFECKSEHNKDIYEFLGDSMIDLFNRVRRVDCNILASTLNFIASKPQFDGKFFDLIVDLNLFTKVHYYCSESHMYEDFMFEDEKQLKLYRDGEEGDSGSSCPIKGIEIPTEVFDDRVYFMLRPTDKFKKIHSDIVETMKVLAIK